MASDWGTHFYSIADKWVDDAYSTSLSDAPPIVYHYTDAAGLVGMLRSHKIWATDYRFLNDKSEIAHSRGIAKSLINRRIKETDDDVCERLYERISDFQKIDPTYDVFVFSLSDKPDDLSQWRGYARDGCGFTVGFCGDTLNAAAREADTDFSFFKMEYQEEKQLLPLERALEQIQGEMVRCLKKHADEAIAIREAAARNFDWMADQRAASHKHASFEAEGEWRILSYVDEAAKLANVKIRASGLRLVNYVELEPRGADPERLPIISLGIGPGFIGPEQRASVEALCRETGYSPKIYSANTPYRRL